MNSDNLFSSGVQSEYRALALGVSVTHPVSKILI